MSKDVLDKLDALLNKHKNTTGDDAPAAAWMPVLTEVVKRGAPPVEAVAEAATVAPAPAPPPTPEPAAATEPVPPAQALPTPEPAAAAPAFDADQVAEQILALLEPRLNQLLTREISATVRKSLDRTVSELLDQLDAHVRNAVEESIRERIAGPPTGRIDS